jgi:hypothetical protein
VCLFAFPTTSLRTLGVVPEPHRREKALLPVPLTPCLGCTSLRKETASVNSGPLAAVPDSGSTRLPRWAGFSRNEPLRPPPLPLSTKCQFSIPRQKPQEPAISGPIAIPEAVIGATRGPQNIVPSGRPQVPQLPLFGRRKESAEHARTTHGASFSRSWTGWTGFTGWSGSSFFLSSLSILLILSERIHPGRTLQSYVILLRVLAFTEDWHEEATPPEPSRRSNRLGPRGSGPADVAGGGSRSSFGDILRFVHDMPSGDFGQDVQDSQDGPDPVSSSASCRSCSSCPKEFIPAEHFSRT